MRPSVFEQDDSVTYRKRIRFRREGLAVEFGLRFRIVRRITCFYQARRHNSSLDRPLQSELTGAKATTTSTVLPLNGIGGGSPADEFIKQIPQFRMLADSGNQLEV